LASLNRRLDRVFAIRIQAQPVARQPVELALLAEVALKTPGTGNNKDSSRYA